MSSTVTATYTYTTADVETVVRRFTADIVMMAQSSGAITEAKAREYAHDVEALAKKGYLAKVDLTLLSGTTEVRATQYLVSTAAGDLTMSRPGGVLWPRVASPDFRIILSYTDATLVASASRDYASNGWGMQRKDLAA
jgi:hypothetical protein